MLGLLTIASPVRAATITFSGLVGINGTPVPSTYSESGFLVRFTRGQWLQGQQFGNPGPSIFNGAGFVSLGISSIAITEVGGGAFTFSSVDLASNGITGYAITGAAFSETGTVGPNQNFVTIASEPARLDCASE